MTEKQVDYVTDAIEMLGAGYEHPSVEIRPQTTVIRRRGKEMTEEVIPSQISMSTDFKKELRDIDGSALKVWIFIVLSLNKDTEAAFPSLATIAKACGIGENTTVRCIRELEAAGLLTVRRENRKVNIYRVPEYAFANMKTTSKMEADSQTTSENDETASENCKTASENDESASSSERSNQLTINQFNQVVEKANKTVDAVLEAERKAQSKEPWQKWNHRDKIPDAMHPLLDTFVRVSKLVPSKKELTLWLMTGSDWLEAGLTPEHIEKAYNYANRDNGFLVTSPNSLTKTAVGIKAKGGGTQSVLPTVEETKAKLDVPEKKVVPRPDYVPRPLLKQLEGRWRAK